MRFAFNPRLGFQLRKQRCTCCDGEGTLVFRTCPMCAHVFLECDEIGTVYPDVLDLTRAGLWQERLLCPHCYRQPASGFLRSTFEEVQGVGMTAEDVETEAGPEYP